MKKQVIRTLHFGDKTIDLVEPVYVELKGSQGWVLMQIIIQLNKKIKELKEQLNIC